MPTHKWKPAPYFTFQSQFFANGMFYSVFRFQDSFRISHHRPECCTARSTSRQNTKARENPGLDLPAVILCLVWTKQDKENGVGRSNSWTIFHLTCYFTVSSTPEKINMSYFNRFIYEPLLHPILLSSPNLTYLLCTDIYVLPSIIKEKTTEI